MKIRTVKPDFYRHKELFLLEKETQLPMRVAFSGIFGVADREGRFKWEPETIKLDVLPFDELDFSWVLDALAARGFIIKYRLKTEENPSTVTHMHARAGKCFGLIPTFLLHQRPNLREAKSVLPPLDESAEVIAVEFPTIPKRTETHVRARGEGKGSGREVEMEGKGSGKLHCEGAQKKPAPRDLNPDGVSSTALTWRSYRDAYEKRHGKPPAWNAKMAGQFKSFVGRVPADEAPDIAAFYVTHNDYFYVKSFHPVGLLLRDAEKLRTEWATGRQVTTRQAQMQEKTSHHEDQLRRIAEGKL